MSAVKIAPLDAGDLAGLRKFIVQISAGDRTYFRDDLLADGVIESWIDKPSGAYCIAEVDGEVAGLLVLEPGISWSAHVGEVRIVVAPQFRRRGIGRSLARHALLAGVERGLDKLVVQVAAEDEATISMFEDLAFEPEALFLAHVRDDLGSTHDLLVLAHFVETTRAAAAAIGIADAVQD
jgi:ribosomal protein S18 acetylase RimI-like enzyme